MFPYTERQEQVALVKTLDRKLERAAPGARSHRAIKEALATIWRRYAPLVDRDRLAAMIRAHRHGQLAPEDLKWGEKP